MPPRPSEILNLPADAPPPDIMPDAAEDLVPRLFRFSRPITRFGEKYRAELNAAENIRVYVNANLVDLRLDASRRMVQRGGVPLLSSGRAVQREGAPVRALPRRHRERARAS